MVDQSSMIEGAIIKPGALQDAPSSEQARREQGLRSVIENRVLRANPDSASIDVGDAFANLTPREKADILYGKLMAYTITTRMINEEKQQSPDSTPDPVDPYLIAEIDSLWQDKPAQDMFVSRFAQARIDAKVERLSTLGRRWQSVNEAVSTAQEAFGDETRALFLQQLTRPDQISAATTRTERQARELIKLQGEREDIVSLRDLPPVAENTDIAATIMFEELEGYHDEAEKGFAWLPSREAIHTQTVAALQNGRWPVLRGEAGTGKSEQADAAAVALTGEQPTHLACNQNTGVRELIADKDLDPQTGGSYENYGPAMQAATGYSDSRETDPTFKTGRIVRFDESGRLGVRGYSDIKELRQKRAVKKDDLQKHKKGEALDPDQILHGKPVLPGFAAIFTTNPEGSRYPDRNEPDAALRRELSYITVDYPPMTPDNPELYEFMLATLMDSNHHIAAAKKELAPFYSHQRNPGEKLPDGREITSKETLVEDPTDPRHGTLYRLSFAIRVLQDAFNNGNVTTIPESALRYKIDNDGKIKIVPSSGEPLTLNTSTITLGEVASWMRGFHERRLKDDPNYQVDTLTDWVQLKLNGYLKQADESDRDKIRAIFDHYHLFDPAPNLRDAKPIIPKEIGYLSPRVPHPVEVTGTASTEEVVQTPDRVAYDNVEWILEDGTKVLTRPEPLVFEKDGKSVRLKPGSRFLLDGQRFQFAGYDSDNRVVVRIDTGNQDEALHKIIDQQDLTERGEFNLILEQAEDLFGQDFIGPEQIENAFGIKISPDDVPEIPFSLEELEHAKELGQFLILRVGKDSGRDSDSGTPMTMARMLELLQDRFNAEDKGKVLYNTDWYNGEEFFTRETPGTNWALVSKVPVPGTTGKDHLQQTQTLAQYLQQKVFSGGPIPAEYQDAIRELDRSKYAEIQALVSSDWQKAAKMLSELKINKLLRQTPVEAMYDMMAYFQTNDERLLEDQYSWTSKLTSNGSLVYVGDFAAGGANVSDWRPDSSDDFVGAVLSRVV